MSAVFVPFPLRERFHPEFGRDLVTNFMRFRLLRQQMDNGVDPADLPASDHATTARLSSLLASHYYDGTTGGVDIFDLIGRLDSDGCAELKAYLFG